MMTADRLWLNVAAVWAGDLAAVRLDHRGSGNGGCDGRCRMSAHPALASDARHLVVPVPPVDGPVTQLEVPACLHLRPLGPPTGRRT